MTKKRLKIPIKMRVSSGGYNATVMATSLLEAFKLFLGMKNPKSLSVLTEIKAKGWEPHGDTFYISTQVMLKELGKVK